MKTLISFLFYDIIIAESLAAQAFAALTARASHGCDIDGLAKMPLQASIFASWYKNEKTEVPI